MFLCVCDARLECRLVWYMTANSHDFSNTKDHLYVLTVYIFSSVHPATSPLIKLNGFTPFQIENKIIFFYIYV